MGLAMTRCRNSPLIQSTVKPRIPNVTQRDTGRSRFCVAQQPQPKCQPRIEERASEQAGKQAAAADIMRLLERPAAMRMRSGVYAFPVRCLFKALGLGTGRGWGECVWGGCSCHMTVGLFNVTPWKRLLIGPNVFDWPRVCEGPKWVL